MLRFRIWAAVLLLIGLGFFTEVVSAAPAENDVKINSVRWSRTTDAVTGLINVRLILETSGPVEVDQFITKVPNWRIVLTLGGVRADSLVIPPSPDAAVVTKMSVVKSMTNHTHVILDFPGELNKDQYKISTVPADSKNKRPFQIIVDMQKTVKPGELSVLPGLKGKVIVVDPGHGGSDPGATGPLGTREKQLNLSLAMQVKADLEKAGAKVLMTRETDIDVFGPKATDREELWARVQVANFNQADIFISIHHNASANRNISGTSTYYYQKTTYDVMLAQDIQKEMLQTGGLPNFGVRPANFFVVKNATMPAALLEVGFLSNPQEEQLLGTFSFQQKMSQAIVVGINQFFDQVGKTLGE
ncbi:MAG TPA: N-acetylmuramoyl-L-alanine amidase [Negativicutes bacterium]|nr:N-acetylmuramoyl-L-alanine amidase [Negativicutes bacterium]